MKDFFYLLPNPFEFYCQFGRIKLDLLPFATVRSQESIYETGFSKPTRRLSAVLRSLLSHRNNPSFMDSRKNFLQRWRRDINSLSCGFYLLGNFLLYWRLDWNNYKLTFTAVPLTRLLNIIQFIYFHRQPPTQTHHKQYQYSDGSRIKHTDNE